jgi:hypothetical protein
MAIPNVSVNVVVTARRQSQKCNVPHCSQEEPDDEKAPGNYWRGDKLADRQKVRDAGKRQPGHEVWPAPITEVA